MNKAKLTLTFHGGAGTVTGSNFLLESENKKILIDCGLVQGEKFGEKPNRAPFPYDPRSIDTLILTHAHADHSGRIPRLVREGFGGTIYSTPATLELSEIMFGDSLQLLREEAKREGELPLYEKDDIKKTLSLWKTAPYHTKVDIGGGWEFIFKDAGHILGSSMIELTARPDLEEERSDGKRSGLRIVFTGDLGNSPAPLLHDTEIIRDADYLIMESVYGDRNHESVEERTQKLQAIIEDTIKKGGVLMIPAFSIERTQILLYEINNLVEEGKIPSVPVFLDSPLAIAVTEVYKKRIKNFNKGVQKEIREGDDIFNFPQLKFTKSVEESKKINTTPNPKIIIAGSGMSNGGRILHHERRYLGDKKSTLLLPGYQAAGSPGRRLQDGAKEITIFDDTIPVRASIVNLRAYSAHKDSDGLFDFVSHTKDTVKVVFVAMGEPKASSFLAQRLRDYLGVEAIVPEQGQRFELDI